MSFFLPLMISFRLTLIFCSFPVLSFRVMVMALSLAPSASPPASAIAWKSVMPSDSLALTAPGLVTRPMTKTRISLSTGTLMTSFGSMGMLSVWLPLTMRSLRSMETVEVAPSGPSRRMKISLPAVSLKPAGHGDDLEQVLAADELVAPGVLDRPDDGHLLVLVLLDEDRHLGVLDVLGLKQVRELLDDALLGQALDHDAPQERHRDRTVFRHPDGLVELFDLEDLELEEVARADPIGPDERVLGFLDFGRHLGAGWGLTWGVT